MDYTPLYIIIGSIGGIASSIVLSILHFPQVVRTIRSGLLWLYRWLRERLMVFNQWRWWRRCCPNWRIDYGGDVRVKRYGEQYKIECPLYLEFRSRHDRYSTRIDSYSVALHMYHKGRGWEKEPYRLYGKIIEPADSEFKLKPRETAKVRYICETETLSSNPLPLLENSISCKVSDYMDASIFAPDTGIHGRVKREGSNRLKVKLLRELIDDASRENTS